MAERSYPPPFRRSASLPPMLTQPTPQADPESARRLHALAELLHTELAYLLDLRTLVSVYLRLLPVLKNRSSLAHPSLSNPSIAYFSRPPPAQPNATFRTLSHPHLHPSTSFPVNTPSSPMHPRVEKYTSRHLFSASDLDTITRNAEHILRLHETLVLRLRQVVSQFGISMSAKLDNSTLAACASPINIHCAINAAATVFVDHASSFDQYQSFCSGHSEAFDLVRKVQHRHPAEWEAFELRCASVAAQIHLQDPFENELAPGSDVQRLALDLCRRRHSLSSLDVVPGDDLKAPTFSASECGHGDNDATRRPRLMFMDYMIKPVQRVCRYPLLFDQLQVRTIPTLTDDSRLAASQDTIRNALRTMRTVARLVDEARRKQDVFAKSAQIVSRITQGLLASVASHNRPPQAVALSTFLSALGPCYLSGSLDVIHYRGMNMARLGTVKAKYLGAFLFPGGFFVLVKVSKSKAYEPKYWFNIRGFELVDSNLDDVLLPSWFRLSSKAHMFEFAASCRREKDIWVDTIRRAIVEEVPWSSEPPSSFQTNFTPPPSEDMPFETISPLPTIQSIPELNDAEAVIPRSGEAATLTSRKTLQTQLHAENLAKCDIVAPSRRSSVAVPALAPESNTFHLVRSTASAREQVDRGLLDVFSEKCLTARFHAHTHEEDLFEAQRVTRSFSRSASALTMASAMSVAAKNRLTKRESVLVPRKKSFVEGSGLLGDTENRTNSALTVAPNLVRRRQHPTHLKIVATTKTASHQEDEDGNEPPLESPSPLSHCSSVSFVTPATPLTVPAPLPTPSGNSDSFQSHSESLNVYQKDCAPKRSKSMIENVCGFFAPRSVSPNPALNRAPSTRSSVSNSGLLRWWSRDSLRRRRVRSAPDVPSEELPSALTTMSLHVEAAPRPLVATADRPYSQPDLHCLYSDTTGLSTMEFGAHYPLQKKGIFSSYGPRRRHTMLPPGRGDQGSAQVPARIRRNFSFLQRFTHATSTRDSDDTIVPDDRP